MADLDDNILEAIQLKRPLHSVNVIRHVQGPISEPSRGPRQLLHTMMLIHLHTEHPQLSADQAAQGMFSSHISKHILPSQV